MDSAAQASRRGSGWGRRLGERSCCVRPNDCAPAPSGSPPSSPARWGRSSSRRGPRWRAPSTISRYYPSFARTLNGDEVAGPPVRRDAPTRVGAPRRRGRDHSVELPGGHGHPEARAGAARREYRRAQAVEQHPPLVPAHRGGPPGRGSPARRCERGPRPGGQLGPALLAHPACSTVTLTGSTASGIEVLRLAAPRVVKCLLELGGKAPVLVAADADLDWAARATVWARFWNAGQACIAAEKCFVEALIAARFLAKVAALVRAIRTGGRAGRPGSTWVRWTRPQRGTPSPARSTRRSTTGRSGSSGPRSPGRGALQGRVLLAHPAPERRLCEPGGDRGGLRSGPSGARVRRLVGSDPASERQPVRALLLRFHARPRPGRAGDPRPAVRGDLREPGRAGEPPGIPRRIPARAASAARERSGGSATTFS